MILRAFSSFLLFNCEPNLVLMRHVQKGNTQEKVHPTLQGYAKPLSAISPTSGQF